MFFREKKRWEVVCWVGETAGGLEIRAPKEACFNAYSDIERMPEWTTQLERVQLVDPSERRSKWTLRVPWFVLKLVRIAGLARLVQWEAVHETEGCDVLGTRKRLETTRYSPRSDS